MGSSWFERVVGRGAVAAGCATLAACTHDASPPANAGAAGAPPAVASCGTSSSAALASCAERERYVDDLTLIAAPRPPGSAHWQLVQDLCATRFEELGYTVERQTYGTGVNVVGTRTGTTPGPVVVVGAHYDHILDCPGADDNATGVAGVLEVARLLSLVDPAGTVIVACWDEEESGLIGSAAFVEQLGVERADLAAAFVFEMIGYTDATPGAQSLPTGFELLYASQVAGIAADGYRGDFIALVPDASALAPATAWAAHAAARSLEAVVLEVPMELKSSPLLADLRRSDHASFWDVDLPAVMVTDTSEFRYPYYHCSAGPDDVAHLDHDFATAVVSATAGATAELLGLD